MNRILLILLFVANTCTAQWREYAKDIVMPDLERMLSDYERSTLQPLQKKKTMNHMEMRCSADSSKTVVVEVGKHLVALYYGDKYVIGEGKWHNSCARIYYGNTWSWYYPDGKLKSEGEYRRQEPMMYKHGWWKDYYPSGNLKRKYYCDAYPCGTHSQTLPCDTVNYIEYYENGTIALTGTYKIVKEMNGGIDTVEITDPETNKVSYRYADSYSLLNVKSGIWHYYNQDGTLRNTRKFN